MLNINIKVKNAKISDSESEYISKQLSKLEKFLRPESKIHVELESEPKHQTGLKYRAEVVISPQPSVYADARGNDFFEALDLCMPKVKEQLMKGKDKTVSLRRKLGAKRKRGI